MVMCKLETARKRSAALSRSHTVKHTEMHKHTQTHSPTLSRTPAVSWQVFFNINTVIQRMHHFRQPVRVCVSVCVHVHYCFKLIILYHLTNSTCGDFPACHGGNFTFNIHSQAITHNKYLFIKSSLKQAMTRLHRNLSDVRNYAYLLKWFWERKC